MPDQRVFEIVVYKAGKSDLIKTGADGYADWASPEVIEKACANFLRDGGRKMGIQHADGTVGAAEVWASYTWPSTDPWIVKGQVVAEYGDWILKGHVLDERTWEDIKAGKFTGVSMQGTGKRRISA
jgi:hypothetical protein